MISQGFGDPCLLQVFFGHLAQGILCLLPRRDIAHRHPDVAHLAGPRVACGTTDSFAPDSSPIGAHVAVCRDLHTRLIQSLRDRLGGCVPVVWMYSWARWTGFLVWKPTTVRQPRAAIS
jgi:hypothetical protein